MGEGGGERESGKADDIRKQNKERKNQSSEFNSTSQQPAARVANGTGLTTT